jgi:hypothetical protein
MAVGWSTLNLYCRSHKNADEFMIRSMNLPFILGCFESIIKGCEIAFLSFLIAAVIRMIEKQAPVGNRTAKRLMIVCCLFNVAHALIKLMQIYRSLILKPSFMSVFDWLIGCLPLITTILIPLLYAAVIFVFYTHITRMVTFESEVA